MKPRTTARLAGALNVLSAIPTGFSIAVLRGLFVPEDPAATAARILASERLVRLGFVSEFVSILIFSASVVLFYELFRPASRTLSRLMLAAGLMGALVQSLDVLADLFALFLVKGGAAASMAMTPSSQAIAYHLLRLHSSVYAYALMYFGVMDFLIGVLIRRSSFLPRAIGFLSMIGGLGYLTFGAATFLSPGFARQLLPFVPYGTAAIGDGVLMLWLLVRGVDVRRWEEQALMTLEPGPDQIGATSPKYSRSSW